MKKIDLTGRVAVVTGAGNGLGRAHALMLAKRGAKVVVNDLAGDGEAAARVAAEIVRSGGEAAADSSNVGDVTQAQVIIATAIEKFGRIDILVNNAGNLGDRTFLKLDMSEFDLVIRVHLLGSAYCTKAAWPHMKEQGYGRVVMTTSGAGLYGNFGQSNYGAAKMGLIGLMNVLKLEGLRHGILVNTVSPTAATQMTAEMLSGEMAAVLKPEFVSAAVTYLSSDSCTLTGQILSSGGGHFAVARVLESRGIYVDPAADPDPDIIAERYGEISDFTAPVFLGSSQDLIKKLTPGSN
ncbi:SDR family NAD(P)-dependent oxidoreductase [Mesorhizobium ciceri]|uniref:SDR family NAD(P)-dependent oxidoreductase n=1 Tax=Mesorhizobium TaxID=68287 RepID=UPI00047AFE64|nr:SDR family NAD(P)-dependent oxidoreductase [Mesorhizobium ciceri]